MSDSLNTINKRIAEYRSLAGYTQETAAKALGMSKSTYARMERTGSPKPETLKKIAEVFNVSAELILYGEFVVVSPDRAPENNTLHDVGLTYEKDEIINLTTTEKNCIKLLRTLQPAERKKLVDYITEYANKQIK